MDARGRAVLVTGSRGFVGRWLTEVCDVVHLEDADGAIDIRMTERVSSLIRSARPRAVIHLAAQSFVPRSFADPRETYDINFYGTLSILTALQEAGFDGRFLYVGSGDTYGLVSPEALPIRESRCPRPRNPYAVSKVSAEALCYQWSQTGPFELILARPFNHIGPGQSEDFAVSSFARQAAEIKLGLREPIIRVGDIDVTRDFTDVRDVVKAYVLLLEHGRNGEAYNVCSGREVSLRSILSELCRLANVTPTIEQDAGRLRRSEQRRVYASFERLASDTGWQPTISLATTLTDLLRHWEDKLS